MAEKADAMTEVEVQANLEDFIQTGRTGRRNAVGDILTDPHSQLSTGGLSIDMDKLKCSDDSANKSNSNNGPSPEGAVGGDVKGS
ncbi:cAMP-dependent protein kinase inhibitor alpha-like isoform X2 [Gigantopelta aegis]|uniref:cAMP-dependent protein kinase inhibitor alpha-like isoform X2 n=1 Tax=Gigantopelta aegis TaxID=1735272 RepID=UPI001B88925E|nr:cAMP-dependent protein kinase inhibitor alpha-like isoform X2 [Gigantopelta aegis]